MAITTEAPHTPADTPPDFRLVAATQLAPAELHAAFTTAFADYLLGPFQVPLDGWPRFLARQCIDLAHSRVALSGDGAVLAFALAAPRTDRTVWRLGTMGAVPAARGSGAAAALLADFIDRARAQHCTQLELECFAQNTRGLRLYQRHSFAEVCALHGYRRNGSAAPPATLPAADVQAVTLDDAFAWLDRFSQTGGDLPLQVTPAALRAQPVPLQAWRAGTAQLIAAPTSPDQWTLHSLVDTQAQQTHAQALVAHLIATHPGATLAVPQLQRDDLGGQALLRLGFERLPLHQLWMRRSLNAPAAAPN